MHALTRLDRFRGGRDHHLQAQARSRAPHRLAAGLVALVVVSTLGVGCGGGKKQALTAPPVPVVVARVVSRTMPNELKAIGRVEPIATVAVRARIGGELQKVAFEEGQPVRPGDVLFVIDRRPHETALRQAEAQLAKDQALLKKAEADIVRYASLVQQDYVTKEQYDQITANADALRAAVEADQASVDSARLELSYCTITSPVGGRTGNLMVKAGNLVKANDQPLVTVNQIKPINVSFSVPAQHLAAITRPQDGPIEVTATVPEDGDAPFGGTLSFVDNTVDAATSTILLKATFANEAERLWPGQFVAVTVTLREEPNCIVAPARAVQTGQQGQYVFVVKDDATVEMRAVKVRRIDETSAVIDSGVAVGETVVTDGHLRLLPGSKVQAREQASRSPETHT